MNALDMLHTVAALTGKTIVIRIEPGQPGHVIVTIDDYVVVTRAADKGVWEALNNISVDDFVAALKDS